MSLINACAQEAEKTAQVAAIVAGLKCTRVGGRTGIPTLKEVSAFVQQYHPLVLSSL